MKDSPISLGSFLSSSYKRNRYDIILKEYPQGQNETNGGDFKGTLYLFWVIIYYFSVSSALFRGIIGGL